MKAIFQDADAFQLVSINSSSFNPASDAGMAITDSIRQLSSLPGLTPEDLTPYIRTNSAALETNNLSLPAVSKSPGLGR